jgi:hypothetical protein
MADTPVEGPCGIPVLATVFSVGNTFIGDFALEMTSGTIGFVQSVWIDNSVNTKQFILSIPGTGQNITVKAGGVGDFPIYAPQGTFRWSAFSNAATADVPMIFKNTKCIPFEYSAT